MAASNPYVIFAYSGIVGAICTSAWYPIIYRQTGNMRKAGFIAPILGSGVVLLIAVAGALFL